MSLEHKIKGAEHWGLALLGVRKLNAVQITRCSPAPVSTHPHDARSDEWALCMHTDSAAELRSREISPGVASLFSGVDRTVIKNRARFGLLPKLNTSAAPPLAAFSCLQSLPSPCWACKPFTHRRPKVLWKPRICQYQSANGSHVFAEWKKPGI